MIESLDHRDGVLDQVRWSYLAQADDGTVYRLGEDVEQIDASGRRVPEGQRVPADGRTMTIAMRADPRAGQWIAGERRDPDRVLATNARLTVAKGSFNRVLVVHAPLSGDSLERGALLRSRRRTDPGARR